MNARHFQEPKDNIIWTKHQEEGTSTQECGKANILSKLYQRSNSTHDYPHRSTSELGKHQ